MVADFEYYDVVGRFGLTIMGATLRPLAGAEVHFTPLHGEVFLRQGTDTEERALYTHIAYVDPSDGSMAASVTWTNGAITGYGSKTIKLPRLRGDRVRPGVPAGESDWSVDYVNFRYVAFPDTDRQKTILDPHKSKPILLNFGQVNDLATADRSLRTAG